MGHAEAQELIEQEGEPALCGCGRHYVGAICPAERLAREAFAGCRPNLMALVLDKAGYEMDGVWHPANGMSLADTIERLYHLAHNPYLGRGITALATLDDY